MDNKLNKVATKAGVWYIIGNLLLKGVVFFSLPIFTRLLSTSDFGTYNAYMAYEGIISAVVGLGLYGSVKNAKFDFKDKFDEYISSTLFMSLSVFISVLLIINIIYPLLQEVLGFSRFVTNCLLFQSLGASFIQFYGAKLNIEFKYKSYLVISIFNSIGSVLLSVALILFIFPQERYLGRILGSTLPPMLVLLFVGTFILLRGKKFFYKKYWNYAKRISLPLVPHVVSQSILSQFDRIMIRDMVGTSEAGIYSYMYTICTITYVICMSLDNAWNPWLFYKLKEEQESEVYRASPKYMELFAFITVGFVCVIPEVAKIMASANYWDGMDLLIPISLSNFCIFLYLMPVSIEYYHKKTKFISIGTLTAAAINLLLNYVFIRFWGYKAAAYTTAISYFILFFFHLKIAWKYNFNKIFNLRQLVRITLIVIVSLIIIKLTFNIIIVNLILRYLIVLVITVFILLKKDYYLSFLGGK